jgi:hypothetical protein
MGCDIHGFIEARKDAAKQWRPIAELYLPRHYALFERLAGVRGRAEAAVVPERGLPQDVSFRTSGACTLSIVYSGQVSKDRPEISATEAAKWVEEKRSQYFGVVRKGTVTVTPNDGPETTMVFNADFEGFPSHITNPDFHSFTWLTSDEFDRALQQAEGVAPEYIATSSAMKVLLHADRDVRIVLWFDN